MDYLAIKGIFAWRNNSGGVPVDGGKRFVRFGYPGSPDILGILPGGKMLCVETKSAKGKLSEAQEAFRGYVERAGGVYVVVRSLEDLRGAGL
jgi:hypothetical protein